MSDASGVTRNVVANGCDEWANMQLMDEKSLVDIEKRFADGLTSAQLLDIFATRAVPLSEATLRKYVQLGLLPRSVRVGRKGKHQGSQGVYPVGVVRQILRIKEMMAENFTIEQIQRDFLFMRSDIQLLEQTLGSIFKNLQRVVSARRGEGQIGTVARDVDEARALSRELVGRLGDIETRLTSRARLRHVNAS